MEKNNTCDGKCLKCDFCKIVPDPDKYDSFNFDDLAVYCTNPNNNMEKEHTDPDKRNRLMENQRIRYYVNDKHWTFICGAMRPYEVDSNNIEDKFGDGVAEI